MSPDEVCKGARLITNVGLTHPDPRVTVWAYGAISEIAGMAKEKARNANRCARTIAKPARARKR